MQNVVLSQEFQASGSGMKKSLFTEKFTKLMFLHVLKRFDLKIQQKQHSHTPERINELTKCERIMNFRALLFAARLN